MKNLVNATKAALRAATFAACTAMVTAAPAQAQDAVHQRFVFVADWVNDTPAADPAKAALLVSAVVDHAKNNGFGYGDDVHLRSVPGTATGWDTNIKVLKSQNTHPQQLEGYLVEHLAKLESASLPAKSSLIWTLQNLGGLNCGTPTYIYVFTNGLSSASLNGTGFTGEGTAPGALANCNIVWVGLGLRNADNLTVAQRMGLDDLFAKIAGNAGASHAVLR